MNKFFVRDLKVGDLIKLHENSITEWEVVRLGFPIYPEFKTYIQITSINTSIKGESGAKVRASRPIDAEETVYKIGVNI